jgi:hypothetical protein
VTIKLYDVTNSETRIKVLGSTRSRLVIHKLVYWPLNTHVNFVARKLCFICITVSWSLSSYIFKLFLNFPLPVFFRQFLLAAVYKYSMADLISGCTKHLLVQHTGVYNRLPHTSQQHSHLGGRETCRRESCD